MHPSILHIQEPISLSKFIYFPTGILGQYVKLIWTSQGIPDFQYERIIPDGCNTLLFNLSDDPIFSISENTRKAHRDIAAIGVMTRFAKILYEKPAQEHQQLGVIFQTGAAGLLFNPFIGDLKSTALNNDEIQIPHFNEWYEKLRELKQPQQRIVFMANQFLQVIQQKSSSATGAYFLDYLKKNIHLSVKDLATKSGYTEQHLNRMVKKHAGVNVKSLQKVLRINRAMNQLTRSQGPLRLSDLAYDLQYFDQAHFIHDLKSITGMTPGQIHHALQVGPLQTERVLYH